MPGDQIALARMHNQIVHRHHGHVAPKRMPLCAAIEGDKHAHVVADEQEIGILVVFPDDIDWPIWQSLVDGRPGGAEVGRLVKERPEIILPMPRLGDVSRAGFVVRREDAIGPGVRRDFRP